MCYNRDVKDNMETKRGRGRPPKDNAKVEHLTLRMGRETIRKLDHYMEMINYSGSVSTFIRDIAEQAVDRGVAEKLLSDSYIKMAKEVTEASTGNEATKEPT